MLPPLLISPSLHVRATFMDAMREFEEQTGRADAGDLSAAALASPGVFEDYVSALNNDPKPVPSRSSRRSHWWWCAPDANDQHTYIGRATLLYQQPPAGHGHIEIAVRPSHRRQGHGKQILATVLPIANGLGITKPTMVTPAADEALRALIEGASGRLLTEQTGRRTYLFDAVAGYSRGG